MRTAGYVTPATVAARGSEWLQTVRAQVAPRPHLELDPARCALLVIDMLHYFADPAGRGFLPATPAIVPNIAALHNAWHALGATVIYTQHCHTGPSDLGMLGKFFADHIRAGRPEAEIIAPLAPESDEVVLRKTTYDAFIGTRLEEILTARGVMQVCITGVLTHMCCETTARAAFCRGFEVYVAADATATTSEPRHVNSLQSMADCVAIVMGTPEILELCAARS